MKKLLICCLATILSGSILISCGSNNTSSEQSNNNTTTIEDKAEDTKDSEDSDVIKTVVTKFTENGYIAMPLERSEAELKDLYFSNIDDINFDETIDDYAVMETGRSPGVGFALILKAKDGKVEDATKIAESVLAKKVGDAFYPDEKEIAQNAKVEVNGDYVSLLILNDDIKEEALNFYNSTVK